MMKKKVVPAVPARLRVSNGLSKPAAPGARRALAVASKPINAERMVPVLLKTKPPAVNGERILNKLVTWRGGSQVELARTADVSRVAVFRWRKTGRVGRVSAFVLSQLPGCPLTFAQIRPDVKNFATDPLKDKAVMALIKKQTAYLAKAAKGEA